MPQLNPAPWFVILIFSWLIFLTILPLKVIAHAFPNEPTLQNAKNSQTNTWIWPWQ